MSFSVNRSSWIATSPVAIRYFWIYEGLNFFKKLTSWSYFCNDANTFIFAWIIVSLSVRYFKIFLSYLWRARKKGAPGISNKGKFENTKSRIFMKINQRHHLFVPRLSTKCGGRLYCNYSQWGKNVLPNSSPALSSRSTCP